MKHRRSPTPLNAGRRLLPAFLLSLLLLPGVLQAQQLTRPVYPPGSSWMEVEGAEYRLLFPRGYAPQARRVARLLSTLRPSVAADLGAEVQPFTLILNTGRVEANGYVTLAPKYSEWYAYAAPRGLGGPGDWYTLLSLHEGRHMAQFAYLDRGFNRIAGYMGGQALRSGFAFFSVPLWFWEGDAITAETIFSYGGRGRSPEFHRQLRAILLEGDPVGYRQAYLGSYRRRFPDHYHLGFPLVAYGRITHGRELWPAVLADTAALSFWPLRFSAALEEHSGAGTPEFYRRSMEYLRGRWQRLDPGPAAAQLPGRVLAAPKGPWRDYMLPHPLGDDGAVVALIRGRDTAAELRRIGADGREEPLVQLRPNSLHFDLSGSRAIWSESFPHPLFASRASSDLVLYDLTARRRRRLTRGGNFFTPVFSPSGERVAAVAMEPGGSSRIVVLDAVSGTREAELSPESDSVLRDPAWSPDGEHIAAVQQKEEGYVLLEFDLSDGSLRRLLPPAGAGSHYGASIRSPIYAGEHIIYSSDYAGREELYRLSREGGEPQRLLPARYGAGWPAWDPQRALLYFSDYSLHGYRAAAVRLSQLAPLPLADIIPRRISYAELLEPGGGTAPGPAELQQAVEEAPEPPPARPYTRAAHLLNIHSWGILPAAGGRAEAFLLSRDVLRSLQLRSFLGYTHASRKLDTGLQALYSGFYPLLRFGLSGASAPVTTPQSMEYGLAGLVGLEFPFDLSSGIWRRELQFGSTLYMSGSTTVNSGPGMHPAEAPLRHSLSLTHASRAVTPLDFAPPWRQALQLSYIHNSGLFGPAAARLAGTLELTLPGPLPHHRLSGRLSGERLAGNEPGIGFRPFRPRGYPYSWREAAPVNLLAAAEYSAPLLYPDFAMGGLWYLKRLRGTLFYDHGLGLAGSTLRHYRSVGAELLFEQHFFDLPASIEFGLRGAYRLEDATFRLEETLIGFGIEW
jgi:hypothetical protein